MGKQIMYDDVARRKAVEGVQKLARAVKVTLGPAGKNVIIEKSFGGPQVTKDGVTVAKEIELEDAFENMGAKLVREVASKTNDVAGDGTTTATLLAEAILTIGQRYLTSGVDPNDLRSGIDAAVAAVTAELVGMSKKIDNKSRDEIAQVATISANNDVEIGEQLAKAMMLVGAEGVVTVEEGKSATTELEHVDGMQFDKGYISPYFITDPKTMEATFEGASILVHEKKISNVREMIPLLEQVSRAGKALVIIAEDVESEALAALVVNRLKGVLNVCAVKAPGFGDRRKAILQDIATLTGGQCISEDLGIKLENVTLEQLGSAQKIRISKDATTLIGGAGKKADITARADSIRAQIEKTTSDYDREKLQERLAKLTGGVALLRASKVLETLKVKGDQQFGVEICKRACAEPMRQIAENAGEDGSVIVDEARSKKPNEGFNALTSEWVDMFKAGIVDPTKVVRCALQNAASIAGLMLTTSTMVTSIKDDQKAVEGSTS